MCAYMNKTSGLSSSLKMETMMSKKQGIVAILGPDSDKSTNRTPASIRRTLSADMSSKNWLSQNGFLKKIASLNEFPIFEPSPSSSSSSSSGEEIEEEGGEIEETGRGFDICVSIQDEKNNLREKNGGFDIWNSILSQKVQEDKPPVTPYIHPLVKQAASSLSEKSLEICTESLGSETGSDGFSSEIGEEDSNNNIQEKQKFQEQREKEIRQEEERESIRVARNSYLRSKKPAPRSFPPPISSLSPQDGASTYMKTRRNDGRLVLEAVSVPSTKCFSAQRKDGRLVLTFTNNFVDQEEEKEREFEKLDENLEGIRDAIEENYEDEEKEMEDEVEEGSFVTEQAPKHSNGLIRVHRLALIMNKPISSANTNPTWPKKLPSLKEDVDVGVDTAVDVGKAKLLTSLAQSLPPRPPVPIPSPSPRPSKTAGATPSFNAYDYYWRPNTMLKGILPNPSAQFVINAPNKAVYSRNTMREESRRNKHEVGKEMQHNLTLNSCKDQRSLLLWEPYCVATS